MKNYLTLTLLTAITLTTLTAFCMDADNPSQKQQQAPQEEEPARDRPLIVVSYNNKAWYMKNLDAIFRQDYPSARETLSGREERAFPKRRSKHFIKKIKSII